MTNIDKFKNRLKELRKENHMTQQELADKIGVVRTAITNYETGRAVPDSETLNLIANELNTTTDYLLGRTDQRNPKEPQLPTEFETPEEAMEFILRQPAIMGFGGFDIDKMSDEEVLEFANELLRQLQLISYKYK